MYYVNLGTVCRFIGEYAEAKEYYEKALSIATEIGDKEVEALCYRNLGTVNFFLRKCVEAKEHTEKALAIRIEIGDRSGE